MTGAQPSKKNECRICGREGAEGLCKYHREACRRIAKHYGVWRVRAQSTWTEYLRELSKNELAGRWIREAAQFLLMEGIDCASLEGG